VGQPLEIAYQIHFQSDDPAGSSSGRAAATRIGNGDRADWKRIVVDFDGEKLKGLAESAPVKAVVSLGAEGQPQQQSVFRNAVTQGWRLSFQVRPPKKGLLELRAFLHHGNDTLTETWSYQLEP
jgi:glucans biosynthesis protein